MTAASAEVFVAEDDPHMRGLLELAVRRAGHAVVACDGGTELLERLRQAHDRGQPPALVVSDNRMPGRAGIEVVEIVRGWGLGIPFALVTGFLDDTLRRQAAQWRVGALMRKPVSLGDLTFMITQLAGRGPGRARSGLSIARCAMCGDPMTAGTCGDCEPTDRLVLRFDPDDPYAEVGGSD
ncbi:MAG: response regulator [Myxococcales bacterium]|nr:response regulator [Myxococcales bacterium]